MNADIHAVVGLLLSWLNNIPAPLATVAVCEKLRFPIGTCNIYVNYKIMAMK